MLHSLRKAAARLIAATSKSHSEPGALPSRLLALDDVPHLGAVYPFVDTIAITLRMESPDREHCSVVHTRTFADRSRADFRFRCKNPDCHHGGFDLHELVARAVDTRRTSVRGARVCSGVESPRGTYQSSCLHELTYQIAIRYRHH